MNRTTVRAILSAAIAVAALFIFWLMAIYRPLPGPPLPDPAEQPGVGRKLATLRLLPLTGDARAVSLEDLKDKVVLVNFWGTWCSPCRDELPRIADLRQRYAGRAAFRLLAVSCPEGGDDDVASLRDDTKSLLARLKLDLPTYYDSYSITLDAVDAAIGFEVFPTTLLLDRNGVIRAIWRGYRPGLEAQIEHHINKLLDEKRS